MRTVMFVPVFQTLIVLGCSPDLSGTWDVQVVDGADSYTSEMLLVADGGTFTGDLVLELWYNCGDVQGAVRGEMDGGSFGFNVAFDEWHCDGYVFEFYDLEVPSAEMILEGADVIELEGDGDWGSASIRFVATR